MFSGLEEYSDSDSEYSYSYTESSNSDSECECESFSYSSIVSDLLSNTDESSFISDDGDFYKTYDKFHIKYILNNIIENKNNKDNVKDNKDKESKNKEEYEFIKKYMENPIVKLTDFEYLIEENSKEKKTIQNRSYRSLEVILGFDYTRKSDYWAFGSTLYELIFFKQFVDIKNDDNYEIYDNDLINLKILIQKTDKFNEIIELIKNSPRKDYLITKTNILKFFKNVNIEYWKLDTKNINSKIINVIENNLKIQPYDRCLQ